MREAHIEAQEERLFARWVAAYQHVSFDEFKAALMPPPAKSEKEILAEQQEIMDAFNKGYRRVDISEL